MTHHPANATATPPPSPAMLAGNKGFSVSTEALDDTLANYPAAHVEILRWWWDLAKERAWSLSVLARQCGVSSTVLSRVFRGEYNAEIDSTIEKLARAKANFAEQVNNPDFIMTSLAKRMFAIFDKTRALQTVTIMWGQKGIGKTTIEEEYQKLQPHGGTVYFRCPGHGCTLFQFVGIMGKAMHISQSNHSVMVMRDKISHYLSRGNRLLIVDELHELFLTCKPRETIRICEWLRELYDTSGCGLALTGTDALHKEFFRGVHKEVLAQLVDRGTIQIQLPSKPTKSDVVEFLRHYGLDFPTESDPAAARLLNDTIAAHGLRMLTLRLRDGKAFAVKRGETYTWTHFTAAFEAIQSLSK
jgi:DNA transposition AAA+ family ATPase